MSSDRIFAAVSAYVGASVYPATSSTPRATPTPGSAHTVGAVTVGAVTAGAVQERTAPDLSGGQKPSQLFIACADSRVVPNLITSTGPGELFTVRNIGNLVPRYDDPAGEDSMAAAIEYATEVLQVACITVCGHSHCAAMSGLLRGGQSLIHLPRLRRWLETGRHTLTRFNDQARHCGQGDELTELCHVNIIQQLDNLLTYPQVRTRIEAGSLQLRGLYLDLVTTRLRIVEHKQALFEPASRSHMA